MKRVERPGAPAGYDRWSETYDATPNSFVMLDDGLVDAIPAARKYLGRPLLLLACAERTV